MKLDIKELKTITLLYVEDDKLIREQLLILLEKMFKKVYIGVDGKDGLSMFKKKQNLIDIVVTDINMPEMNGLDMIYEINKLSSSLIPTVVTTAHTDSKYLLNAIDNQVDKYIKKPIQVKELLLNIVNLVLKYRKSNKLESLAKGLVNKSNHDDKKNKELGHLLDIKNKEDEYNRIIIDNFVSTFQTDKNGIIIKVSKKFCTVFDYLENEVLGKSIEILKCQSCNQESFQKLMLKAIHLKETINSIQTLQSSDGKSFDCNIDLTPIYGDDLLISGYTFYIDFIL
ncbi:MAG: response regulator [Campylobacterota bacterium]|nr:response regulator [Campylobacterota bacterium]